MLHGLAGYIAAACRINTCSYMMLHACNTAMLESMTLDTFCCCLCMCRLQACALIPATASLIIDGDTKPCCPHFGEATVISESMLGRVWDGDWYLCEPSTGATRREGSREVHTVYLIPCVHPEVAAADPYSLLVSVGN